MINVILKIDFYVFLFAIVGGNPDKRISEGLF